MQGVVDLIWRWLCRWCQMMTHWDNYWINFLVVMVVVITAIMLRNYWGLPKLILSSFTLSTAHAKPNFLFIRDHTTIEILMNKKIYLFKSKGFQFWLLIDCMTYMLYSPGILLVGSRWYWSLSSSSINSSILLLASLSSPSRDFGRIKLIVFDSITCC